MAGLRVRTGKGETVRQERTSDGGDPAGSVNPTRSKAKRGKWAARPLLRGRVPQVGRSDGWPPKLLRELDRIPPTGRLTVITRLS
jgi:hypothetical protein